MIPKVVNIHIAPRAEVEPETQRRWSPRKLAGKKRAIGEVIKPNESLGVENQDEEAREIKVIESGGVRIEEEGEVGANGGERGLKKD